MKVLVCGGRAYDDREAVYRVLSEQHRVVSFTHLIHGDSRGVDHFADQWAIENGVQSVRCAANWDAMGRAAGPLRNQRMLDLEPHLVIAFPGGRGTADMIKRALEASIQVYEPMKGVT